MNKVVSNIIFIGSLLFSVCGFAQSNVTPSPHEPNANIWVNQTQAGPEINLHFFWSSTCPHCKEAHPFIDALAERYSWIHLQDYLISEPGSVDKLMAVGELTGVEPKSVPYFAVCGEAIAGYNSHDVTGRYILQRLEACYQRNAGSLPTKDLMADFYTDKTAANSPLFETCADDSNPNNPGTCGMNFSTTTGEQAKLDSTPHIQPVDIPLIGAVQPEQMSLPVLTLVLAGVDAFNPCAFFVLLFLLSIMVNAGSRGRMLLVGGIFVFFSGFIYFIFMSAWLNLFQLLGGGDGGWIITGAGVIALVAAIVNIKDFFFGKGDVSLSMSVENRGSLIKRMGKLSKASSLPSLILGSALLAIMANAYELLCTAGFPMIYTSVLSISGVDTVQRYLYLIAYNLIYIIPLATIVIVFAATLGKRKLTEKEGEVLKLMSGIMMLGLGSMLVINPMALQNVVFSVGLIAGSILLTYIVVKIKRYKQKAV
ncbi:cytochrome C biosynthesis protein [Shewanella sp. UCD-KL21]|uniref:cytochrome C biosynthesis protein n=1 Tax=Shewanella sp. UCD-KL21 TaxID=1917164 RepID=UPI0009713B9B|nr:cytochrome C biosynthesis protein [Shewanella sp. UCD-KL21]